MRGVLMKKFFIFFSIVFVLSACATPPTDEMDKALNAVTRAENDIDAVTYAPTTVIRARDALMRMQSEVDAKRYGEARNYASEAITNAERAIAEGRAGSARAKEEAANLLGSLSAPLSETSKAVEAASRDGVQNSQVNFNSLSNEMNMANRTYSDAVDSFQENNYHDAITGGQNVRSLLVDIKSQLNGAVQPRKK
jgi:hypothetical protein